MKTPGPARRVAVILAGGRGRRLGGADKPLILVRGRTLLSCALEAAASREKIVVVGGPFDITDDRIVWTREEPRFGGPAAALMAALAVLDDLPSDAEVLLLAADLPEAVRLAGLLDAVPIPEEDDGLVATDGDGREQWRAGRHRLDALRRVRAEWGDGAGVPMKVIMHALRLSAVDVGAAALDLDTWEAIDEYRDAPRHPGGGDRG
ncbi:NTP transferase domain-containing protein [Microbacterium esteraromaticum]|uniref:NTP transferase domain-containing protein n=1 Tax=Microbacterium esteraromaticum TaxID=57043 RepID=A0A7D7W9Z5_9MICO|nr:NTP transferase domain-containing protein [Microbacterium esteraromaticum]QMU97195.1 NTP transferase domain-containing protein [Microbacterium esteraromaticum]